MTFANPLFLRIGVVLAVVVVLATWNHARRCRRLAKHLGGRGAAGRLSRSSLYRLRVERMALLGLVAIGMAGAAAQPAWIDREAPAPPPPVPTIVLAIDLSASMQAAAGGETRLSRSVEAARELVASLPEARVGVVLFSGTVYRLVPPTLDRDVLPFYLDGLQPSLASAEDPGTLLSAGVRHATELASGGDGDAAVILFSDGETSESEDVVLAAVRGAAERGVVLHTIGFEAADEGEMVIPRTRYQFGGPVTDPSGAAVVSRPDDGLMARIAQEGGGRAALAGELAAVRQLGDSFARTREGPGGSRPDPGRVLTLLALAALSLESLLDLGLPRRAAAIPRTA